MMKQLLILFICTSHLLYGQQWYENSAIIQDTSKWKKIREDIKYESIFLNLRPSVERYLKRAYLKAQIMDYQGAINDLNKCIEIDTNDPYLYFKYYKLAVLKEWMGDLKGAKKDFTKSIDIFPGFEWSWNDRALVNIKLKKYRQAKSDLYKAIELNPKLSTPVANLGYLYEQKNDIPRAIDYFLQSIKIDSTSFYSFIKLGNIFYKLDQLDSSIYYYSQAIKISPNSIAALSNRAEVRIAKGDSEGACEDMLQCINLGYNKVKKYYKEYCEEE